MHTRERRWQVSNRDPNSRGSRLWLRWPPRVPPESDQGAILSEIYSMFCRELVVPNQDPNSRPARLWLRWPPRVPPESDQGAILSEIYSMFCCELVVPNRDPNSRGGRLWLRWSPPRPARVRPRRNFVRKYIPCSAANWWYRTGIPIAAVADCGCAGRPRVPPESDQGAILSENIFNVLLQPCHGRIRRDGRQPAFQDQSPHGGGNDLV
jgi:hypothetical protein